MKNSTSVAGMADAMPFAMNAAMRRRNKGSASGAMSPVQVAPGAIVGRGAAGARSVTATHSTTKPANSAAKIGNPLSA